LFSRRNPTKSSELQAHWPLQGNFTDSMGGNPVRPTGELGSEFDDYTFTQFGSKAGVFLPQVGSLAAEQWFLNAAHHRNQDLTFDKPFTISTWFNPLTKGLFNTTFYLLRKGDPSSSGYYLRLTDFGDQENAYLTFSLRNQSPDALLEATTKQNGDIFNSELRRYEKWQHIVVSYDGSYSASGLKIFHNGRNCEILALTNKASGDPRTTADLLIGGDETRGMHGATADVRLFNRCLNESEIGRLYEYELNPELYRRRVVSPSRTSSGIPLFVEGRGIHAGLITLFTTNFEGKESGISLHTWGYNPILPSSIPLHTISIGEHSSGVSLFAHGHLTTQSGISLYASGLGSSAQGPLNLYLHNPTFYSSGFFSLFTFGTEGCSGHFGGVPLHLYCDPSGNYARAGMNMFLETAPTGLSNRGMNLFSKGEYPSLTGSVNLFLANSGVSNTVPLWISGHGISPGYYPASGWVNLYISRDPTSAINLYLHGQGTEVGSGTPLFSQGFSPSSSGVAFYASGVGNKTEITSLFTHGF
jgi:hypothetical protein